MFPEGNNAGLYHTADATLWYFHAIASLPRNHGRSLTLVRHLLPTLRDIVESISRAHASVSPSIPKTVSCDKEQHGFQLTWMDAKVGDFVVTPRRGKAVEICALWYNALSLLATWETRLTATFRPPPS